MYGLCIDGVCKLVETVKNTVLGNQKTLTLYIAAHGELPKIVIHRDENKRTVDRGDLLTEMINFIESNNIYNNNSVKDTLISQLHTSLETYLQNGVLISKAAPDGICSLMKTGNKSYPLSSVEEELLKLYEVYETYESKNYNDSFNNAIEELQSLSRVNFSYNDIEPSNSKILYDTRSIFPIDRWNSIHPSIHSSDKTFYLFPNDGEDESFRPHYGIHIIASNDTFFNKIIRKRSNYNTFSDLFSIHRPSVTNPGFYFFKQYLLERLLEHFTDDNITYLSRIVLFGFLLNLKLELFDSSCSTITEKTIQNNLTTRTSKYPTFYSGHEKYEVPERKLFSRSHLKTAGRRKYKRKYIKNTRKKLRKIRA